MEQKIPLHPISSNSYNRPRPHPLSTIEPNYPWIRYLVGAAAFASIFGVVILVLMLALPISMLVIGVRYRDFLYCPIEPRISRFLIVGGSVSLISIILTIALSLLTMFVAYTRSIISIICVAILGLVIIILQIFSIIWLIIGSVWTFSIRNRVQYYINYPFNFRFYCNKTLYQFTFAYLIIIYILLALQIGCQCCLNIFRSKKQRK
jgi:hypothetical protein